MVNRDYMRFNDIDSAWRSILIQEGEESGTVDSSKHIRRQYDPVKKDWVWETKTLTKLQQFSRKLFNSYNNVDENLVEGFRLHLKTKHEYITPNLLENLSGVEQKIYAYIKNVWGKSKADKYLIM